MTGPPVSRQTAAAGDTDDTASIILSARDVSKHFALAKPLFGTAEFVYAVAGVSFDVRRGETVAIVGESGCGKSTLARLLLRLLKPSGGEIVYEGRAIGDLPEKEMRPLRRDMQIVFQDPYSSLNPRMRVGDLITEPLWLAERLRGGARRAEARRLLTMVGLRSEHADRYPHEFSGGQRQRIGIARALLSRPKLLIGDEPVSALDVSVQAQIINLLEALKDSFALTLIIIAHDLAVIRHMSQRVLVMYLGQIVESAATEDLYAAPLHPYTRALMDSIPLPSASSRRQFDTSSFARAGGAEGDAPNPARPPSGCRFHTRCPYAQEICREVQPGLDDAGGGRAVACHFWRVLPASSGLASRIESQSPRLARRLAINAAARTMKDQRIRSLRTKGESMRRTRTETKRVKWLAAATLGLLAASALPAVAQTLRIGLQEDPDILDPTMARSFVGRIVFNDLCDKLLDITPDLKFVPRLATAWQWSADGKALTFTLRPGVKFQNGEVFDASAVKADLERDMTMPESIRKAELASVASIDVVDPLTVRLNLKAPDASLLATLTDRAGMMFAPKAAAAAGNKFGLAPVCSGPFKFVERVQQDHITLEADPNYWNANAFHFNRVIFRTIPNSTVRVANLRSGDLDMIERIDPSDVANAKSDPNVVVQSAVSLGYEGMTFNINNGPAADNPFAKDKRLRQAVSLAIDRKALNDVVFDGQFTTAGQAIPLASPYHSASFPPPAPDVEKAKALVKAAGYDRITLTMETANSARNQRIAEVLQAMLADANIDLQIKTTEFATQLSDQLKGQFQSVFVGWSGRPDPDGDIHDFMTCKGGLNDGRYCNADVDKYLDAARGASDFATRNADYEAAQKITLDDLPIVFIYYDTWIWGLNKKIQGFVPAPDGMIRLDNVSYSK